MTDHPSSRPRAAPLRACRPLWLRLCVCLGLSCATLAPLSACAETRLIKPAHASQSLVIENSNLSARGFHTAYLSKDLDERRQAEMYLLGVLDASEGREWCGYRTIKTITVDEAIFTGFKKLDPGKLDERASTIIRQILSTRFPCGARP